MENILWLSQIANEYASEVGGKGGNLGEIFRAGFPVPNAFVITTSAYQKQMNYTEIKDRLTKFMAVTPAYREEAAQSLMELVEEVPMLTEIADEIQEAYRSLGDCVRVAVRSSATSEDLADASFAGQQETFLGVHGEKALLQAIRQCWASLWSPRAVHYRDEQGFAHEDVALAVVVQEMVESEAAGVMFTVNPITKNKREMMISSSYGLGEAVVSGDVTPDMYTVLKQPLEILNEQINCKKLMVVQREQGSDIEEVPTNKQLVPALQSSIILKIAELGSKIENHYGSPQDIEWAVSKGKVNILQSRPITTLTEESSISLPGYGDDVYGWVYLGRIPKFVRSRVLPSLVDHMPVPLRPFDIATSLTSALSGARRAAADLGIKMPADITRADKSGLILFSPPVPSFSKVLMHLPFALRELKRWTRYNPMKEWEEVDEPSLRSRLQTISMNNGDEKDILSAIKEVCNIITENHYRRFRKYMAAGFSANRKLNRFLSKVMPGDEERTKQKLMQGLAYKTAVINQEIKALTRLALRNPAVKKILTEFNFDDSYNALLNDDRCAEFVVKFKEFLNRNGCRTTIMEPEPSYPTWQDEPYHVISLIAALLRNPESVIDDEKEKENEYRKVRMEIMQRLSKSGKLQNEFELSVDTLRGYTVAREGTLYFFEECVAIIRKLSEQLGSLLTSKGLLRGNQDIYYLMLDELEDLIAGEKKVDYALLSRERQKVWERMRASLDQSTSVFHENAIELKGSGASPGIVTGTVKVIRGPHEFYKLQPGDILVCTSTNPSWTPLFSVAGGVVADTGSALSHAAIVAREYRIPAVMACEHATYTLSDGDRIVIDGAKGLVRILQ